MTPVGVDTDSTRPVLTLPLQSSDRVDGAAFQFSQGSGSVSVVDTASTNGFPAIDQG
jgi:hypothetical protein